MSVRVAPKGSLVSGSLSVNVLFDEIMAPMPKAKELEELLRLEGVYGFGTNPKLQMVTMASPPMTVLENQFLGTSSGDPTHSFGQGSDSNNGTVKEVHDLHAGDGVEEMELSWVPCKNEYLGLDV